MMSKTFVPAPGGGAAPVRMRRQPIDRLHLARQTLGDPGLELEVLRLFDTSMQAYFARLQASTAREDLLFVLHTIRGAAAGVGATDIALLARRVEADLRDGLPVDPERVDDLHMAIVECSAFIEAILTESAAPH